jgi:molybdopterin molybdotransferase
LARPPVLALQRVAAPRPRFLRARLARAVRRNPARDELVRSRSRREGDDVVLDPLPGQDSHMIVRAAAADALALVPRGEGELPAGSPVDYLSI